MIHIAYTGATLQQLHDFVGNDSKAPQRLTMAQNHIQNWVLENAASWQLHSNHNHTDVIGFTVTAQLATIAQNGDRTVNITHFQA
ncbi:MAG TPA: hypothetical protein VES39_05295 [Rhodospirillales bacterium]|nr:hypothetical protein [Rhodospirillales bacterium]